MHIQVSLKRAHSFSSRFGARGAFSYFFFIFRYFCGLIQNTILEFQQRFRSGKGLSSAEAWWDTYTWQLLTTWDAALLWLAKLGQSKPPTTWTEGGNRKNHTTTKKSTQVRKTWTNCVRRVAASQQHQELHIERPSNLDKKVPKHNRKNTAHYV